MPDSVRSLETGADVDTFTSFELENELSLRGTIGLSEKTQTDLDNDSDKTSQLSIRLSTLRLSFDETATFSRFVVFKLSVFVSVSLPFPLLWLLKMTISWIMVDLNETVRMINGKIIYSASIQTQHIYKADGFWRKLKVYTKCSHLGTFSKAKWHHLYCLNFASLYMPLIFYSNKIGHCCAEMIDILRVFSIFFLAFILLILCIANEIPIIINKIISIVSSELYWPSSILSSFSLMLNYFVSFELV